MAQNGQQDPLVAEVTQITANGIQDIRFMGWVKHGGLGYRTQDPDPIFIK